MAEHESLNQVVDGGFCSGCGACAYVLGAKMQLNAYGEYLPELPAADDPAGATTPTAEMACPFLRPDLSEDRLAKDRFDDGASHDPYIGYHVATYGGYVREGSFRPSGTSGGMGTWIGVELLKRGMIDGVIHVKPVESRKENGPFFNYAISRTENEIREGAKTRYHVIEISEVMSVVREHPGRYLFIGIPCLCKAVRRLQMIDPVIAERIVFVASLVCGHLKSVNWTLSLGWGMGIRPRKLATFQYRMKGKGIPARAYVFQGTDMAGNTVQKNSAEIVGGKFNAGALMLKACDYCDDVVGEVADITIGDAWLPKFDKDSSGTNLIIVRSKALHKVLLEAGDRGGVQLEAITAKEAADSQVGGFRHRREGLSYRLQKAREQGEWIPGKRVEPGSVKLSKTRRRIYEERLQCARRSREAFKDALEKNDYACYVKTMKTPFGRLRRIELRSSFFRIVCRRIRKLFVLSRGGRRK